MLFVEDCFLFPVRALHRAAQVDISKHFLPSEAGVIFPNPCVRIQAPERQLSWGAVGVEEVKSSSRYAELVLRQC